MNRFHENILAPGDHAAHAERTDTSAGFIDRTVRQIYGTISAPWLTRLKRYQRFLPEVHKQSEGLELLSDDELRNQAKALYLPLRRDGIDCEKHVARAFAIIREASWRTLGMKHFDSQLIGGRILLAGKVAEMATGEGKTLTATLAAGTAAMAGIPTHVVTANDYLTERDCAEMTPVYELLGISVGNVSMNTEQDARREQYERDICYCANKDVAFDYLRDSITLGAENDNVTLQTESLFKNSRSKQLNLRGLHFAIVDEADSVLIDDARTPLIISANRGGEEEEKFLRQADALANQLIEDEDYSLERAHRLAIIEEKGQAKLEQLAANKGPLWVGRIRREEVIRQALAVKHFYQRDHDYVVVDNKIQIVDENTGRILPDRSWERGLHQLVEIKEGCDVTQQRETLARISYQRFFRRYLRLAGMTGTAHEVRRELWDVYALRTVPVPTNKVPLRHYHKAQVTLNEEQHVQCIIDCLQKQHKIGRPILVGTANVAASEDLSDRLTKQGLDHQLLNAKQDDQESQIIAAAGTVGCITIATQMAGRGTDIKLQESAKKLGGLYVLLTQRAEAARVDRQLAGRCARQGDPGGYEEVLCLQHIDARYRDILWLSRLFKPLMLGRGRLARQLLKLLLRLDQYRTESHHARSRRAVFKQDEQQRELLAFSGRSE